MIPICSFSMNPQPASIRFHGASSGTLIDRIRSRRPHMSVIAATAYMEEADRFDWLAAMDAGRIVTTGSPDEIKKRAGESRLEDAFVSLLPEEKRRGHRAVQIPPRQPLDGPPAIEAEGLTKTFGKFTAVDNVSFRIEKGEIFGFLGSNGCGKSTTMKMLTGLLPASAGRASLLGQPINSNDIAIRRRVGYMSQSFSLYRELTVRQNLDLHAGIFELPQENAGTTDQGTAGSLRPEPMRPTAFRKACRSACVSGCNWRSLFCTNPKY